jgi:hypothetical protein
MFRKIHSNRDPGDTLHSSLRKEFSVYFDALGIRIRLVLKTYPKQVFAGMVVLILGSTVFTLFLQKPPKSKLAAQVLKSMTQPAQKGFSQILTQADALSESLRLRNEILTMIALDTLSRNDSIRLQRKIDRFHELTLKTSSHDQN